MINLDIIKSNACGYKERVKLRIPMMEAPTRRTASSEMTTAAMAPEPRVRRLKEKSSSFDDTPSLKKKSENLSSHYR